MKVIAISREAHAPAAVVRAARLLERFEVKQLLAATPLRDSCLSGPARLLDAIREWRQFFDPPKVRGHWKFHSDWKVKFNRGKSQHRRGLPKIIARAQLEHPDEVPGHVPASSVILDQAQKKRHPPTATGATPSHAATTKARSSRAEASRSGVVGVGAMRLHEA